MAWEVRMMIRMMDRGESIHNLTFSFPFHADVRVDT